MYLKSIELENFKSFGGKVTIPLMDGYMAVTGPNGSGKSNIGDAIMFVLGPRSPKAVRAQRIPDLVFSGTGKGKADHMKATLVFENSDRILPWDADEVRLTRFIKLKGENKDDYVSYFYINDQAAKLADFEALLSKARISADGYNIVQQGDVTGIIQMGGIERRRILDGISGISSFDADLAKAAKERTDTEASLDRIQLIRGEKAQQLSVLEKQRAEALRYQEAKEHLDGYKAQLSVRLRDNESEAITSEEKTITDLRGEIGGISTKLEADKTALTEKEAEITAKENEIESRTGPEYTRIKSEVEAAKVDLGTARNIKETKLEAAEEKDSYAAELEAKVEEYSHSRAELQGSLDDSRIQLEDVRAKKAEADKITKTLTEEVMNHGGEMTAVQKRIQDLEAGIDAKSAAVQDLSAKSATAVAVCENAEGLSDQAQDTLEAAKFDLSNAEGEYNEVSRSVDATDVDAIGKEILEISAREKKLSREEEELRSIFQKKSMAYNRAMAEKSAHEAVSGGGEAYNRILALKTTGEIKGIHGAVCDLASVKSGFETAISVAAGNKARAIVVEDDAVAAKCIAYLRENRLGRVTFLPLTKMQPGRPSARAIMVLKQTLGYASDFVDFDPKYANVFWYVFGDTLVTSDLDGARAIMGAIRIVTKGGDLIEKSGAMTGGTVNNKALVAFGGTGSTSSELNNLAAEVDSARVALQSATDALRAVRDQMREADDRLRKANMTGAEGKGRIAAAKAKLDAAKGAYGKADADAKKFAAEAQAARDARAKAEALTAAAVTELQGLRDQLAESRDRLALLAPADLQERIEAARNESYNLSVAEGEIKSQIQGAEAEIQAIDNQKTDYLAQIDKARKDAAALRDEAQATDTEIERLRVELDAKQNIQAELENGQQSLRAQRDALMERKWELMSAIEKAKQDIEVKGGILANRQASVDTRRERLAVYQAEVDAIVGEVPANPPSEDTLRRNIRNAEADIAALGNVNLAAVQQYDDTLYTLQQVDEEIEKLNNQITALENLEADITAKKKGIFMEAYNAIDANFKTLFTELSGGGEAYMSLENPDDPFSGGLFINAKPRNGTMLRLEALSGGEKSLTALSFIFAIQEYQPSPFYVLDEVDMFLDAVNTELVAAHIKTQSGHTQFIQVSLRKVALTKADNLIGVTRPPSGISKIIMQVDMSSLDKLEEEAQKRQLEADKSAKPASS